MNKVKPLLDKLGIKPIDSWTTLHKYNNNDVCYYYVFKVNGIKYCVSGDSISFVFFGLYGRVRTKRKHYCL